MDKLLANSYCKLGNITYSKYIESKYGISCKSDLSEYLDLFIWAYNNSCLQEIQDCSGGNKCNIKNILGKLTKYCQDCKPKRYKEVKIEKNSDYTCWLGSQEYIDCLQAELESNGYLEEIVNLCVTLEPTISITPSHLFTLVTNELIEEGVDCLIVTSLQMESAYRRVVNNLIN